MDGALNARNKKLRCSYHKDHGHRTENCKTLKQFLEGLVAKGHLDEYLGKAQKPEKVDVDNSDDDGPLKRQNKEITGVINIIHACTNVTAITKTLIKVQIKKV